MLKKKKVLAQERGPLSDSDIAKAKSGPMTTSQLSAKTGPMVSSMVSATLNGAKKKGLSAAQKEPMATEPKGKVTDAPGFKQEEGGEWRQKYLDKLKKRK